MPLTGNFGPWPPCSETCTFLCHLPCQKIQGLSNRYRHLKLFSISTGRNKPPGEISQSPRPRPPQPPVTHTVCRPGCRRLVRPHTSGPHTLKNQLHSTWPPRPHSLAGPAGIDLRKLLLPARQVGALDECISSRIDTVLVIIAAILANVSSSIARVITRTRCVDNRVISSRYQSRIATVIHITGYDLTNCTLSEPFVASLCGGLWSASPPASGRGPLLVTAQKLPQRRRAPRDPRPTVRASDLWGF